MVVVPERASVTRTVKELTPVVAGVPEMTPVLDSDSPAGSDPADSVHV